MRLAFVGDIYLGSDADLWLSAEVPNLHETLGVDLVVGNFESTVDGSTTGSPHPGKIHLSVPGASLSKLKEVGIDAVSVANNHVWDYGPEAARRTIASLQSTFGINRVFGWRGQPAIEPAPGLRIVGACFSETNPVVRDGDASVSTHEDLRGLLEGGSPSPGSLLVYAHWGEEFLTLTGAGLRRRAREFIEDGASHIVGMHSHVVGASESIGESRVVYSLGNFLFTPVRRGNVRMLRRARRGTVAVFSWDGTSAVLEEFWRSEFDERLNLRVSRIGTGAPGTALAQLHLRAPAGLAAFGYRLSAATLWFNLGLGRIVEGVERPSVKKLRTALSLLTGRRST